MPEHLSVSLLGLRIYVMFVVTGRTHPTHSPHVGIYTDSALYGRNILSKYETLIHCCFNVVPASQTVREN